MGRTVMATNTQAKSEPEVNANELVSTQLRAPEREPHHQMQFGVIPKAKCQYSLNLPNPYSYIPWNFYGYS